MGILQAMTFDQIRWGLMALSAMVAAVPGMLVAVWFQKHITRGFYPGRRESTALHLFSIGSWTSSTIYSPPTPCRVRETVPLDTARLRVERGPFRRLQRDHRPPLRVDWV